MAEEHGCEAPEGHLLCANNCGYFGSPATLDLCSKCYRDHRLKVEQAASAISAVEKSLQFLPPPSPSPSPSPSTSSSSPDLPLVPETASPPPIPPAAASPNRCAACRKRVGLTGFACRCGAAFCGSHRYPEQHGCSFDFKAAGRAAIAVANPVVKAAKLHKI